MFRSGPLTPSRLRAILAKVQLHPHNLRAVAKACMIYPADLMAWYLEGQNPECRNPLYRELAWGVNEARFARAAANLARIEAAANGGSKRKVVSKPKVDGEGTFDEVTVEDVLPAAWAIEKLEEMQAASHWEISPNNEQADDLHAMMRELEPTPLLGPGEPPVPVDDPPDGGEGNLAGVDDPERPGTEADAAAGAMPEAPSSLAGGHAAILPVELCSCVDETPGLGGRAGAVDEGDHSSGSADAVVVHSQNLTPPE